MVKPIVDFPQPRLRRAVVAEFTSINCDIIRTGHSCELYEILKYKGHKLALSIDSDAYKFQSSARVSIFHPTDLKWNHLVGIHYEAMVTMEGVHYMPDIARFRGTDKPDLMFAMKYFLADRNMLLRLVKEMLD